MEHWVDAKTAARWASFPADESPRPIVLLDDTVRIEGGFVGEDAKRAWTEGAVEPGVPVPPGVLSLLRGTPQSATHFALTITDCAPVAAAFRCDRGLRELPAYRLRLTGLEGACIVLAPEVECWWPADDAEGRATHGESAVVDDDGVTIDFPAFGGILTEFHHAEFQEHGTYVVGRAITTQRTVPPGTAVVLVGLSRMVRGRLTAPLGGRALITTSGQPVAVTTRTADSGERPSSESDTPGTRFS